MSFRIILTTLQVLHTLSRHTDVIEAWFTVEMSYGFTAYVILFVHITKILPSLRRVSVDSQMLNRIIFKSLIQKPKKKFRQIGQTFTDGPQ